MSSAAAFRLAVHAIVATKRTPANRHRTGHRCAWLRVTAWFPPFLVCFLGLTGPSGAMAQIECAAFRVPTDSVAIPFQDRTKCGIRLGATDAQLLQIEVVLAGPGPVGGERISVHPSAGVVSPGDLITDARGQADFWWRGRVASANAPVTIDLRHSQSRQTVYIAHQNAAEVRGLGLEARSGNKQAWFSGHQLRQPLEVTLPAFKYIADSAECEGSVVVFRALGGGSMAPDTARGSYADTECIASTRWNLGSTVGTQFAEAVLVGGGVGSRQVFEAKVRQPARLAMGFAWVMFEADFDKLSKSVESVTETRVDTVGTDVIATVTTKTVSRADTALTRSEENGDFDPVVGVDFPLLPDWGGVRLFAGISVDDPTRFFYVTLSVLQPFFGTLMEATAIDARLGFRMSRRATRHTTGCGAGESVCEGDKMFVDGPVLMVSVDATKLFSTIVGAVF